MADSEPETAPSGPVPGSPQWWRDRPAVPPASAPTRGRPPRSFDEIVGVAADLVEEVGPQALTMRLLAERLGTSTATLYRHVSGREELLVHVVDHVLGRLVGAADATGSAGAAGAAGADPLLSDDWQDAARRACLLLHATLTALPHLVPLVAAQVPIGPNGLALRERMMALLVGYGFAPAEAARTYTTLARYVLGFTLQELAPGSPGPQEHAALGAYYRSLDPTRYPTTIAAADALTEVSPDAELLEGLDHLLHGIDNARRRP